MTRCCINVNLNQNSVVSSTFTHSLRFIENRVFWPVFAFSRQSSRRLVILKHMARSTLIKTCIMNDKRIHTNVYINKQSVLIYTLSPSP
jgi:hypothetical protein